MNDGDIFIYLFPIQDRYTKYMKYIEKEYKNIAKRSFFSDSDESHWRKIILYVRATYIVFQIS